MELLWIILGMTLAIAFIISYYWIKFSAPVLVLITGLSGVSIFLFSVYWAVYSTLQGELFSASLGLITLGIPAILLMATGWKMLEVKSLEQPHSLI